MTEAERIWAEKNDDALIEAAAELEAYTEEGQRIIRAELKRRGQPSPHATDSARGHVRATLLPEGKPAK